MTTQHARAVSPEAIEPVQGKTSHAALAESLLSAADALTDLLDEETQAVAKGVTEIIKSLSARKAALFAEYEKTLQSISDLPDLPLQVDTAMKDALRKNALKFKASVERNQHTLETRLTSSKRFVESVGQEIQRKQRPINTYSAPQSRTQRQAPTTLALNQTV